MFESLSEEDQKALREGFVRMAALIKVMYEVLNASGCELEFMAVAEVVVKDMERLGI